MMCDHKPAPFYSQLMLRGVGKHENVENDAGDRCSCGAEKAILGREVWQCQGRIMKSNPYLD